MARGDHIYASRKLGTYTHHGIDCGDGTVIHFTGEPGTRKTGASVARTPIAEFAKGSQVKTRQYRKHFAPDVTVARAESELDTKGYNIAYNNCEHFATWCCTGRNKSRQVRNAVGAGSQIPIVLPPVAAVVGFATVGAFLAGKLRGSTSRRR